MIVVERGEEAFDDNQPLNFRGLLLQSNSSESLSQVNGPQFMTKHILGHL